MKSWSRITFLLGGVLVGSLLAGVFLAPKTRPAPAAPQSRTTRLEPVEVLNRVPPPSIVRIVPPVAGAPRLVPVRPVETQPVPAMDGFQPVPLTQLRQRLPDNEVWLVRTVLLNPDQGTLAEPGGWAAPAQRFRDGRTWK